MQYNIGDKVIIKSDEWFYEERNPLINSIGVVEEVIDDRMVGVTFDKKILEKIPERIKEEVLCSLNRCDGNKNGRYFYFVEIEKYNNKKGNRLYGGN